MDNKIIKEALKNLIAEEKTPGISTTKKVQDESGKFNKAAEKEVGKKMKEYDKAAKTEEQEGENKFTMDEKQVPYHNNMEIRNGQEMIKYDQEPGKRFKDRAEKALKGHSTMGNEIKTGKWNPETGEGNGNTEPVWGASDAKFGEKLINTAKEANKMRDEATPQINQFGDDVEYPKAGKTTQRASKKTAFQEGVENKEAETINENKTTMKRLRFKDVEFGGPEKAIKLIPEHYKVDEKEFEMTDGNETYHVRWEGSLNEGEAVVISGKNEKLINEDIEKMKKLWGFKSKETLGTLKPKERANETVEFKNIWGKTKDLLK